MDRGTNKQIQQNVNGQNPGLDTSQRSYHSLESYAYILIP